MPPSGYIKEEAKFLSRFLASNIERLINESHDEQKKIEEKIQIEISDIIASLKKNNITTIQIGALNLSLSIYERLSKKLNQNGTQLLENFHQEILKLEDEVTSFKV